MAAVYSGDRQDAVKRMSIILPKGDACEADSCSTLARLIAKTANADFKELSATRSVWSFRDLEGPCANDAAQAQQTFGRSSNKPKMD